MPARTPVVNPSKLTDADKTAVIAAFKTANKDKKDFNDHVKADPDGIKFNDDGTKLIVTYQDGSKLEIVTPLSSCAKGQPLPTGLRMLCLTTSKSTI